MANLYYNAAVDLAWDTLGNWWNDDIFTDPALALPATGDTVYLYGYMTSGPTTPVTLNHIYAYTLSYGGQLSFTGAIGNATFQDSQNSGTVTGDATFNGSSNNFGTVTGDATFNDTSINYDGTVTGNATFNGTSYNRGEVAGDATFNDSSYNDIFGEVAGEATLNDYSYNGGILGYFNEMPTGIPVTFNDNSYNASFVYGDATFNDSSYNAIGCSVNGNATFNDFSYNGGSAGGATFNDFSFTQSGGSVGGDATFDLTAAATQIIGGYNVSFYGGVVVSGGAGGGGSDNTISRLLDLPWFINL
jgi:hypothetical protein